jgi:signal transduction histidine kinase
VVRLGVRAKLVFLSLLILVVVSFSFMLLQLRLSRAWIEEDLKERAVLFAREVAAVIGDRRQLEGGPLLERQLSQIMGVRRSVLHLDILRFDPEGSRVIASSHATARLPFTRREAQHVHQGQVVSRMVADTEGRSWEVLAPITLDDAVAGAIAAKFSLKRFDAREAGLRRWDFLLTAAFVLLMGSLMTVAVHLVVNRPIRQLVEAIGRVQRGNTAVPARVDTADEFGVLARHFNEMLVRIEDFNSELQRRIKEATHELEGRYQEVQRLHEQLFVMQRRLSHSERLALAGRVMAEVAHEVGTPLHSVAGHLELLRQDLQPLSDEARRRLGVIDGQLARVTEIIAQLLDLTRPTQGEPQALDLGALVSETAEIVRPGIVAGGLALEVEKPPALPAVVGHASQLQQVVLNLLTNAMDATPVGGRIQVCSRVRGDGDHVELEVRDSGRGIPAAQHKQIFEPFFSTKGPGGGLGLGLFISAQIVREHRGVIEVASREGEGSVFRVVLPAVEAV